MQGDTTVSGSITGNEVFVGKNNAINFTTIPSGITLSVTGSADGTSGANISYFGHNYPDGKGYSGLNVFGGNTVNFTGGHAQYVRILDTATTNISAGYVNDYTGLDGSTTHISGGFVDIIRAQNSGIVNISGGILTGYAQAKDMSTLNITAGTVKYAQGNGFATVNISGGDVETAYASNSSTLNISGGNIRDIFTAENGIVNLTGGTIGTNTITLNSKSVVNIFGSGLSLSSAIDRGGFNEYTLYGTLQNGQSIDGVHIRDYNGGYQITNPDNPNGPNSPLNFFAGVAAAPEPGSLALLEVGLAMGGVAVRGRIAPK